MLRCCTIGAASCTCIVLHVIAKVLRIQPFLYHLDVLVVFTF